MEDSAWYLIAREVESDKPVAFSHFRYVLILTVNNKLTFIEQEISASLIAEMQIRHG